MDHLTEESLADAAAALAARDADLAGIFHRLGPPPLWAREPGFPTLVRIVLEQQVSLASARAAFRRLVSGVAPFSARRCVEAGEAQLRAQGLTRQKAAYCVHIARSITERQLHLAALSRMSDGEARAALTSVKGVGPWTADIYLLMALRRPDIWPSGDLALLTSLHRVKRLRAIPTPQKAATVAEAWRPLRAVAARMLWQDYLARIASRKEHQTERPRISPPLPATPAT